MSLIDIISSEMVENHCTPIGGSDPEIRIMLLDRFVELLKENKIDGFKFDEKNAQSAEITHDKDRIRFYLGHKDIYEYHKITLNVNNWEWYRQEVTTMEDLANFKKQLTEKPFLCYSEIEAVRDTKKQKNVTVDTTNVRFVACVYPNSPKIKEQIDKAFVYAEEHMKNKKKFDLYINLQVAFWEWYKDILYKITQDKFYIGINSSTNPVSLFHIVMKTKGFFNAMKMGDNQNFVVKDPKIEICKTPADLLPEKY